MSSLEVARQDLIVLVADKNMESAVQGLLTRTVSLKIRAIKAEIHVHIERDPGCYQKGHVFLLPFSRQFDYAMILFDRIGSGQETKSRRELEQELEEKLRITGWADRSAAVVIDPELENWVWSDSPHVARVLGWDNFRLRTSIIAEGWISSTVRKPAQPKEVMDWALRSARKPRSSSIYRELASAVTLTACVDEAFLKFKRCLQNWFGDL